MGFAKTIEAGLARTIEGIWPSSCALCGSKSARDGALCGECWGDIPFIQPPSCKFCGVEIGGEWEKYCETCEDMGRNWDQGFAVASYDGAARNMVLALKKSGGEKFAPIIASLMQHRFGDALGRLDILTSMPIHWTRRASRGFNQSALIGFYLSKLAGIPMENGICRRARRTKHNKKGAGFDERFSNLEGAFEMTRRAKIVENMHVGIIDDVLTSGASIENLCHSLRGAGCAEISVFVFARTEPR